MKRVLVVLFFIILSLVSASHHAYAEIRGSLGGSTGRGFQEEGMPMMPPMGNHGMGVMEADHPMWRHLMDLGLDEKQNEAIKKIKSRLTKDTIRKRADLEVANVELKDILDMDSVDLNSAEAKLKKIESLLTDIRLSHIKALEEVKAMLTPEQKNKFKEVRERDPMTCDMMHGGVRIPPSPTEK